MPVQGQTVSEGFHAREFIISEANGDRSREEVTLLTPAADVTWAPGTVLGIVTASGKYTPVVEAATDGRETPAAILVNEEVWAAAGADRAGAIVRRDAEVHGDELTWPGTYDAANITAGIATLAALGIIVRINTA
jgi:hypothetical protein